MDYRLIQYEEAKERSKKLDNLHESIEHMKEQIARQKAARAYIMDELAQIRARLDRQEEADRVLFSDNDAPNPHQKKASASTPTKNP